MSWPEVTMANWLLIAISGVLFWACSSTGHLRQTKFEHADGLYEVARPTPGFIPGDRWRVANFTSTGKLRESFDQSQAEEVDTNDDGRWDLRYTAQVFDLVLENVTDDGRIVLTSHPLSRSDAQKALNLHAERIVTQLSGTVQVSKLVGEALEMRGKRFGVRQVAEGPVNVSGEPAYRTIVDIIDLDRAATDPEHAATRVAFVVAYLPKAWPQYDVAGLTRTYEVRSNIRAGSVRFLWVASCANDPGRFDSTLLDFGLLLEQTRLLHE